MAFEIFRTIHFVSLMLVTCCLGISYFSGRPIKWARILGMSSSFFLMLAGFGMLGTKYSGMSWPLWIKIKIVIWILVAISGPMMAKRLKQNRGWAFSFLMGMLTLAIVLAVFRPF